MKNRKRKIDLVPCQGRKNLEGIYSRCFDPHQLEMGPTSFIRSLYHQTSLKVRSAGLFSQFNQMVEMKRRSLQKSRL